MIGIALEFLNSFGIYLGVLGILIYWFIKENIYYIPDISGIWKMDLIYLDTTYNPYKNMRVKYKMYINQDNNNIDIKGEKFYEKLSDGSSKEYNEKEKTSSSYSGQIKRGFINHKLILNIEEQGLRRKVVGQLVLNIQSPKNLIKGKFTRQDANSSGIAILRR